MRRMNTISILYTWLLEDEGLPEEDVDEEGLKTPLTKTTIYWQKY